MCEHTFVLSKEVTLCERYITYVICTKCKDSFEFDSNVKEDIDESDV